MNRVHFHGLSAVLAAGRRACHLPACGLAELYLWVVPTIRHGLVVDYVGETSASFYRRTKEHAIQVLGGNYLLLDPDAMLDGERKSSGWGCGARAHGTNCLPS